MTLLRMLVLFLCSNPLFEDNSKSYLELEFKLRLRIEEFVLYSNFMGLGI
jgi:hypothetical protein